MKQMVREAQGSITGALEELCSVQFVEDRWSHAEGGGGLSRILQDGATLEKAGVNVASVWGTLPPEAEQVMLHKEGLGTGPHQFAAVGLSIVIHPRNPHAPIVHANYRYFELDDGRWWFGGGADLTPIYVYSEDAELFHRVHRDCCDRHDKTYYPRFKAWCDGYFDIKHRGERRGVGGIFFDDLRTDDPESAFAFVSDCAASFLPAYIPILARRRDQEYGERELRWQGIRRSRYVEFNLMYDRGTRFGLRTGGRVESILMSMPPTARWEYGHQPQADGPEARTLDLLREPRDWVTKD